MPVRSKFKSRNDAIEEEAKKLKEDEETALVYQQFIETFEESTPVNKTWVKGGVTQSGVPGTTNINVGGLYQPRQNKAESIDKIKEKMIAESIEKPILGKSKKKSNLEAFSEELKQIQRERELRQSKPRELDLTFLEDSRKPKIEPLLSGSLNQALLPTPSLFDIDYPYDAENDKTTTNLFLGNLSPELTEPHLCELFGRYGPLASVKIMWPRNEEEKARGRHCGFVAYMNRNDGERALNALRGTDICGFEMKMGWGKPVAIPPHPVYIPPKLFDRLKPPTQSGLPFNAQPREWLSKMENREPIKRLDYDMFSMSNEELFHILKKCVVKVCIPIDRNILQLINRMVEFVIRDGMEFEAYIMNKEVRNPAFKFLFDFQSPEHTYYRWRLYSILHGDSPKSWKLDEFQMFKGGPFWIPPPINPYLEGMPDEFIDELDLSEPLSFESLNSLLLKHTMQLNDEPPPQDLASLNVEATPTTTTSILTRTYFTDENIYQLHLILADLTPGKFSIGEAMVWCMERADYAEDILSCIVRRMQLIILDKPLILPANVSSLEEPTPSQLISDHLNRNQKLNQAIALLFLLSDLLHNSSSKVKNASFFRKHMEHLLPQVMNLYHQFHQTFHSKVKSEMLKNKVLSCFRAWGDWYVYPFEYLWKLQNTFLGIVDMKDDEEETVKSDVPSILATGGSINTNSSGATAVVSQWKSLVDYDGDPLDIDGQPLEFESSTKKTNVKSSVDPSVDKSVDMFDMFGDENPANKLSDKSSVGFLKSKWETVETVDEESDALKSRWQLMEEEEETQDADGYPLNDEPHQDLTNSLVNYAGDSDSVDSNNTDDFITKHIPLPQSSKSSEVIRKRHRSNSSNDFNDHRKNNNDSDFDSIKRNKSYKHKHKKSKKDNDDVSKKSKRSNSGDGHRKSSKSTKKSRDVDKDRERRSVRPLKDVKGRDERPRSNSREKNSSRVRNRSPSPSTRDSQKKRKSNTHR